MDQLDRHDRVLYQVLSALCHKYKINLAESTVADPGGGGGGFGG